MSALVSAVTLRVVKTSQDSNAPGRRSSLQRDSISARKSISVDETLDLIKLVIVGDSGVGKTCLMLRFVRDEFVTSTRATIGMDFLSRQVRSDPAFPSRVARSPPPLRTAPGLHRSSGCKRGASC